MSLKKTLSILLAVLLIVMTVTSLPFTANAADVDTAASGDSTTIDVSTASELETARNTINENGGSYTINLTADIVNGYIGITNANAEVTVVGNGHTISRPNGNSAVYASNGAVITLGDGNSSLTISSGNDGSEPGIVYVLEQSVCNMADKVTLKDHKTDNYLGGGVTVQGGTFHMYGGTIENCGIEGGSVCFGGGVAVFGGGTFIMDGGTIKDCYAYSDYIDDYDPNRSLTALGGGVFVTSCSTFTMNGGTISNNTATNMGGGVAMVISDSNSSSEWKSYRMGNPKSSVTINGGTITGNSAKCGAGILASGYYYAFAGPIGSLPESGPTANPGLHINGGEISANQATESGGGAFVAMIRPAANVQIHGATVKNNTADNGAGIMNFGYWTQLDIDGCTITGNSAVTNGGGILLSTNSSGGFTNLKNTTITGNTSGDRGAGVYYDANSQLKISGADVIQNNTYDGKLNNLNILSKEKPVYVTGALTGSQIGLSDPTLWDDEKTDEDETAVSTDYLTSGYTTYNSANPSTCFTSDHNTWFPDFSESGNEVRLVRSAVNYHINNTDIAAAKYYGNDVFNSYVETAIGKKITPGETITAFYTIPQITPTSENSCPYIFKGWYYDQDNSNDENPVVFGSDVYTEGTDIYAHWIKVENVTKDSADKNRLPAQDHNQYGGFDLSGIQIRRSMLDTNFNEITSGGMRFVTSLSMKVVSEINAIKSNNIEYGYVAATNEDWIDYHKENNHKLQYISKTANGIDTSEKAEDENYFDFAKNINCTSKQVNDENGVVDDDHQNYNGYLLYSLVITYNGDDGSGYDQNVLARPYIRYSDANGLERVAYSEYRGQSNTIGGCRTSYNAVDQ